MRRTIILAAALSIIVLGLWGTVVIYFDQTRLRSIVSDRLSQQLGRRVEIAGSVDFSFFPNLGLSLEDVLVASAEGTDGVPGLSAERISMTLRVLPLLRGELAPGRMSLDGALIDLSSETAGSSSGASLAAAAAVLAGRSLQLRDVTVRLPGDDDNIVNEVRIAAIDLDDFSLDRTVSLRFRGDLGRPPVLSDAHMSAQLYVPSSGDAAVRLRDMNLEARLPALGQDVLLAGDLSLRRRPAARVSLSGGRIALGGTPFNISFDYRGGASAALDVMASGTTVPRSLLAAVGASVRSVSARRSLVELSDRANLRAQLQFDRVSISPLELADLRVDLRSQNEGVGVDMVAAFRGGLAEVAGVLTGAASERLIVDLSFADVAEAFTGLRDPAPLGGTGEARGQLTWPSGDGAAFSLDGNLQLWDGFWRVASAPEASPEAAPAENPGSAEPRAIAFDQLSAEFRITPGYLAIPQLRLSGGELAGDGWAAADLPQGQLGGELIPSTGPPARLEIEGQLSAPRLSIPSAAEPGGSGDAEDSPGDNGT